MQEIKILYSPVNQKDLDKLLAQGFEVFSVTEQATYLRKTIG